MGSNLEKVWFLNLQPANSRSHAIQTNTTSNMKISKIYVLNAFSPFSKAWNQSPIEYSIEFSLYQRLNSSFGWIFNGFGHLLISRSIFARWGRGTLPWGPGPRAQKCFDRLVNDQIHWISNQMMNSTAGKGKIRWNIQSAIDYTLLRKGKRHLVLILYMFVFVVLLFYMLMN